MSKEKLPPSPSQKGGSGIEKEGFFVWEEAPDGQNPVKGSWAAIGWELMETEVEGGQTQGLSAEGDGIRSRVREGLKEGIRERWGRFLRGE